MSDRLGRTASISGLDATTLDLGLPDISGPEVARRIRGSGSAVPILMLPQIRIQHDQLVVNCQGRVARRAVSRTIVIGL